MRFREEKIALSADIEAMFSQVAVPKEDQPVLYKRSLELHVCLVCRKIFSIYFIFWIGCFLHWYHCLFLGF